MISEIELAQKKHNILDYKISCLVSTSWITRLWHLASTSWFFPRFWHTYSDRAYIDFNFNDILLPCLLGKLLHSPLRIAIESWRRKLCAWRDEPFHPVKNLDLPDLHGECLGVLAGCWTFWTPSRPWSCIYTVDWCEYHSRDLIPFGTTE